MKHLQIYNVYNVITVAFLDDVTIIMHRLHCMHYNRLFVCGGGGGVFELVMFVLYMHVMQCSIIIA